MDKSFYSKEQERGREWYYRQKSRRF
jgi:hypothetical protein